jgi:pheromone shutdown-related protein TraB
LVQISSWYIELLVSEVLKKIGDQLFLIGVAHVLPTSAAEVGEVIKRERPDVVAVELCPTRYLALTQGERRAGALDAAHMGPKLLLLGGLLWLLQNKFSRQTGMPAGEEMLVAIKNAREIGARIELIDRDIGLTFQRLIDLMPWRERLRLFAELLIGLMPVGSHVKLERLTDEQIVDYLLEDLKRASPIIYEVLIQERDAYMASKLLMLLSESKKVVCVVGAGHVSGIFDRLSIGSQEGWGVSLKYEVGG